MSARQFEARIHAGVGALPEAAWTRLFPNEAEGWAYYRACEAIPPKGVSFSAIAVHRGEDIVAAAPIFDMTYRLDTPLQDGLRSVSQWLERHAPRLVSVPVVALGSPMADRLHLGIAPELGEMERRNAIRVLLSALEQYASKKQASVIAIKDLADREADRAHAELLDAGFTRIASLPVAVLRLPYRSEEDYLRSLSPKMRRDIRRKLRSAGKVRIEIAQSIDGLERTIYELYEETRSHSRLDYGELEQLSSGYFLDVMQNLGEKARCVLCWLGNELIGFNLLFLEPDRVIDKFIGMRYPLGPAHNLYMLTWMTNVRFCMERNIGCLQSGQTAYALKLRLGSELEKSWVYFRHRGRVINKLFKTFGPLMAFDKLDPDLSRLRSNSV
jgi:hypothetical protein